VYASPNPSYGSFSIVAEDKGQYELYSIAGQKVFSGDFSKNKVVETSGLAKGLYILKIMSGAETVTQKMQIE
jgi:hypothetical protein